MTENERAPITDLLSLHAAANPRLRKEPPISLPTYTFLVGQARECFDLWKALTENNDNVYTEDFLGPIYDGVCEMLQLGHGVDLGDPQQFSHPLSDGTIGELVEAISELDFLNLENLLLARCQEMLSMGHNYNFVIRDAAWRDLTKFPDADSLVIHLDQRRTELSLIGNKPTLAWEPIAPSTQAIIDQLKLRK